MKAKFSLLALFLAFTSLYSAPAKAGLLDWLFPPAKPTPTHMPINGGIVFLVVAGLAIGILLITKAKARKAVKA